MGSDKVHELQNFISVNSLQNGIFEDFFNESKYVSTGVQKSERLFFKRFVKDEIEGEGLKRVTFQSRQSK